MHSSAIQTELKPTGAGAFSPATLPPCRLCLIVFLSLPPPLPVPAPPSLLDFPPPAATRSSSVGRRSRGGADRKAGGMRVKVAQKGSDMNQFKRATGSRSGHFCQQASRTTTVKTGQRALDYSGRCLKEFFSKSNVNKQYINRRYICNMIQKKAKQ